MPETPAAGSKLPKLKTPAAARFSEETFAVRLLARFLWPTDVRHEFVLQAGKENVVIDCDCGLDDAQALLIALTAPNINVVAITCVYGNCEGESTYRNVLRTLATANRLDIPVFVGCDNSLLGTYNYNELCEGGVMCYHGRDGLGDVEPAFWTNAPYHELISRQQPAQHASVMLVEIFKQHPNKNLTLITLGPLTNIAVALRLDSQFAAYPKQMLVMGGSHTGRGNTSAVAEQNFAFDPEAAHAVVRAMQAAKTRLVLFGMEIGQDFPVEWTWTYRTIWTVSTAIGKFLHSIHKSAANVHGRLDATGNTVVKQKTQNHDQQQNDDDEDEAVGYIMHDEWVTAYLRDPHVVQDMRQWPTQVDVTAGPTRGMCIVDKRTRSPRTEVAGVACHVISVNKDRMREILQQVAGYVSK